MTRPAKKYRKKASNGTLTPPDATSRIALSPRDTERVISLLLKPPKPTVQLRAAARRLAARALSHDR